MVDPTFDDWKEIMEGEPSYGIADGRPLNESYQDMMEQDGYQWIDVSKREDPVVEHGTILGYTNGRCRCKKCRLAWREYMRDYRRRRMSGR